jgi:hypothetical protein
VAALAGASQAEPRGRGRALGGSPLEYFAVDGSSKAPGRVVVVPARPAAGGGSGSPSDAGPPLAARAAAAAQAHAAALVVCEPDSHRALTAIPGGAAAGIPVIGLRGDAAARALELTPRDGGLAFLSVPEQRRGGGRTVPAVSSSRGPTYALDPKPDLAAPGTATVSIGGRSPQVVAGTSVAAARAAATAALLHERLPSAKPDDLAAALVGTARPLGPPLWTGAGELRPAAALAAGPVIEPATLALPREPSHRAFTVSRPLTVANIGTAPANLKLAVRIPGLSATVTPAALTVAPGRRERITLTIMAAAGGRPAGFASGRITATGAGAPVSAGIGLPVGPAPPAPLGPLTLVYSGGRTRGVRFTAGALTIRGGARSVVPLGNVRLQLVDASGRVARELTPIGGSPDLLPGEYAYTLTSSVRSGLSKGTYAFVARARGTAGGAEIVHKSPSFTVR